MVILYICVSSRYNDHNLQFFQPPPHGRIKNVRTMPRRSAVHMDPLNIFQQRKKCDRRWAIAVSVTCSDHPIAVVEYEFVFARVQVVR